MAFAATGLDDVVDIALTEWRQHDTLRTTSQRIFGAAGMAGPDSKDEMLNAVGSRTLSQLLVTREDPMSRMFATPTGQRCASLIGNESRTLASMQRLSVEILARALRTSRKLEQHSRLIAIPADDPSPPILMILSPDVVDLSESRIISDEVDVPPSLMLRALRGLLSPTDRSTEAQALQGIMEGGIQGVSELFAVAQPEILRTRRPRMVHLCAPSPHVGVEAGGRISTAGILCHDEDGELGITACFHGTGDVGTDVLVDLRQCRVKRANAVQDTVFVPLGQGYNPPPLVGARGVLDDREPPRAAFVRFDGATNQNCTTRIFGADVGLLRPRPSVQLRIQTGPDTDEGDSGCALVNDEDQVLGFAFERTAFDDFPQFTDWIWAANALRALKLKPYDSGN